MQEKACTLIELVKRCHERVPELAMGLPIEPEDKSCPGLYGKGCAGELVQTVNGESGQPFWRCHMTIESYGQHGGASTSGGAGDAGGRQWQKFLKRGCGYKLYPKTHMKVPVLSISISGENTVEVLPAEGGSVIVSMCGGVEGLLRMIDPALLEVDGCTVCMMRVEYNISSYRLVLKQLLDFKRAVGLVDPERPWFGLEPIPGSTQNQYLGFGDKNRSSDDEVNERFGRLARGLRSALLPFQREGIKFVLQRKGRALIADEMGVGKTVQGIALAGCYSDKWPVLVVVPASLRLVWAEEFEKWMPHLAPSDIHVIFDSADKLRDDDAYKVVITSYDMLRRLSCSRCCEQEDPSAPASADGNYRACPAESCIVSRNSGWKIIIADESHKLATSAMGTDSQITNAVRSVCRRADHVVFLTGTPSLNKPFDLYNQINMIRRDVLPSTRDAFGVRYCDKRLVPCRFMASGFRYDYSGLCRSKELHLLLRKEVMIRRMKTDIAEQLPEKTRQVVRLPEPMQCDWPPPVEIVTDDQGNEIERKRLSQFHRVGIAKSGMVVQWLLEKLGSLEDNIDSANKVVVFAHHKKVMNRIASKLDETQPGIYVRIDGETDSLTRHEEVAKFQLSPEVRVAVVSVTAGGTGLDFSAASGVIFAELPPHASLVRQAEDRVHRRGQKNNVNVFFLCAMNTFDDRQWQFLNKRLQKVDRVHNGPLVGVEGGVDGSEEHEQGLTLGHVVRYGLNPPVATRQASHGANDAAGTTRGTLDGPMALVAAQLTGISELTQAASQMPAGGGTGASHAAPGNAGCASGKDGGNSASAIEDVDLIPDSQEASDDDDYQVTGSFDEWNPRWQFVVSRHTKRVHIFKSLKTSSHADDAARGTKATENTDTAQPGKDAIPVLFSVPIMAITGSPEDCLRNLLDAYAQMERSAAASDIQNPGYNDDTSSANTKSIMLQGIGPMFIDRHAVPTVQIFEAALHQCTQFAREWIEIPNIYKDRLFGRLLQRPLDAAVEEEIKSAQVEGEMGTSRTRYASSTTTSMRGFQSDHVFLSKYPILKEADELHGTVSYNGRVYPYVQAVLRTSPDSDAIEHTMPNQLASAPCERLTRLCLNCVKPADSVEASAFQEDISNPSLLFCSIKCENDMKVKSSGGAIRSQIMKRDRGVCEICKLNCTKLIQRLQAIEKEGDEEGEDSWRTRRARLLEESYPEFTSRLTKAQKNGLIDRALSGKAWQADHIVGVFEGGGRCTLANMWTLCTACHREVTAQQAARRKKERAALKKERKQLDMGDEKAHKNKPARKKRKSKAEKEAEAVEVAVEAVARRAEEENGRAAGTDPEGGTSGLERILSRAKRVTREISDRRAARAAAALNESLDASNLQ